METFETWLLYRVAQAIEAGEVPADLLAELRAEFESSRKKPPEQSQADAVRDISLKLRTPVERVDGGRARRGGGSPASGPRVGPAPDRRGVAEGAAEGVSQECR